MTSRLKISDYICCRCHNATPTMKAAHHKKKQKPNYMAYDRERQMAKRNPLRAAYRAIGLEQHNLLTKGRWRG